MKKNESRRVFIEHFQVGPLIEWLEVQMARGTVEGRVRIGYAKWRATQHYSPSVQRSLDAFFEGWMDRDRIERGQSSHYSVTMKLGREEEEELRSEN